MKPKPTKQTDLEGNVIKEYKSLSEASKENGYTYWDYSHCSEIWTCN